MERPAREGGPLLLCQRRQKKTYQGQHSEVKWIESVHAILKGFSGPPLRSVVRQRHQHSQIIAEDIQETVSVPRWLTAR